VLYPEHPDVFSTRCGLANVFARQGRYTEAEEMHRQKLEIRERVLGAEHPDTLWSRHSLAVTLQKLNRYAEAEEMDRQTLELRERVLGAEHPDTLRSCDSLAEVLARLGGHDDAERVRRGETLTRATDTMGNEAQHPQQSESHRCCLICMSNEIVWVCVHGDV
jgi:tetratricopeptide (TPR) repeat protein